LLFPFADRHKLRRFSPSVRRPLQITAPDIAKVSSRLASRTPSFPQLDNIHENAGRHSR
jgi:hypothetical protein